MRHPPSAKPTTKRNGFLAVLLCALLAVIATKAHGNPLQTAPMPTCGPTGGVFDRYLKELKQRKAWRGAHENGHGDIEVTVGRDGSWYMFYYSVNEAGVEQACVIARGIGSRETFGRPV